MFDVDYLFLKIRSKSSGETVDINILCPDDENTQVMTKVNLEEIKVKTFDGHNNLLNITDTINIVLKYPTLSDIQRVGDVQTNDGIFKLLYRCVHEIHHKDDVYHRVDMSDRDIEEFVDQLTAEQFERVVQFFQTMPKLSHTVSIINPKTNVTSEVVMEGLQSFLG